MKLVITTQTQRILAAGIVTACCFGACSSENTESLGEEIEIMSDAPSGSQPAAAEIEPIEFAEVRYEEDKINPDNGDQNGGYLAAFDIQSGEKLWRLKVYEVADYSEVGVDNIGLYFRSMELQADANEIHIVNQAGTRYRVNLADRTSTYLDGPSPDSDEQSNIDTRPKPPPL